MGKSRKQGKNAPNPTLETTATAPEVVTHEVHGFEYEVPRNDVPAVVKFFCRAASCPGYPHKPSELAHPTSTCGSLVNAADADRALETISQSEFDDPPELELEHRTQPANDLPEVLPSNPPEEMEPMGLVALEQLEQPEAARIEENAHTSHDMPPLDALPTEADGWELPETPPKPPLEPLPVDVRTPDTWQPPAAPFAPQPPPAGTWLRRSEGLSTFPDYVRVVGSGAVSSVIVFLYPNHWVARGYTAWEFQGLEELEPGEQLPDWVHETHKALDIPFISTGDTSKTVAADGSVKVDESRAAPPVALEQPEEDDLPPVLAPPENLPVFEEPAGIEDFWPDVGSFWFDGKLLYEIIEHKLDKRMMIAAEYGPSPEQRGEWSYTDRGMAMTVVLTLEEFGNQSIFPFDHCPPPWVLDYRASRVAQDAIALHEKTTMRLLEVAKDEIRDSVRIAEKPEQNAQAGVIAHPLAAISSCMNELALELDVKPLHVFTTVETLLQTVGQIATLSGVFATSPAIESLISRLSQSSGKGSGLHQVIALAVQNIVSKVVDERFHQLSAPILAAMAGGATASQKGKKPAADDGRDKSYAGLVEEVRELVEADCRRMISEAFEAWSAKHRSPVNPDDWAELAKDLGKVETRTFKIEGQIKDIAAEIGHINKSLKLQKEDPLSAADRGKAFRQRQKEKADEKAHNLAKLRQQKAADEALMNEDRPKKAEKVVGFAANGKAIDRFMGKARDANVRALLGRIAPAKLPKFLEQAQKALPNSKLTPWKPQEMSTFAKWYYATANKR